MTEWQDWVTSALLGTTRRPPPVEADIAGGPPAAPELRVLNAAAAHGVAVRVGRPPGQAPPAEPGPSATRPPAPRTASRLLDALLQRPEPALVNQWLVVCVRNGSAPRARHWPALATLAARSAAYDRALIGAALGERGRWFLSQNPEWRRVAAGAVSRPVPPASVVPLDPQALASEPERIFAQPDPWPDQLVAAALAVLAGGRLGSRSRSYAVGLGARLPLRHYRALGAAAQSYLQAPDASPAQRRALRGWFQELERTAYARLEIEQAFAPAGVSVQRVRIPAV